MKFGAARPPNGAVGGGGGAAIGGGSASPAGKGDGAGKEGEPENATKEDETPNKEPKLLTPEQEKQKKQRTALVMCYKQLGTLKSRASLVMASAHMLLANIDAKPEWEWAKGSELKEMMCCKKAVDDFFARSKFWECFNLHDVAHNKKHFDVAVALNEMKGNDVLAKKLGGLEKKVSQIKAMQEARSSV